MGFSSPKPPVQYIQSRLPYGVPPAPEPIEPELEAEADPETDPEKALLVRRTLRGRRSLRIDPAVRTSGGTGVGIPPA
ncbi:MAG TPA: hypothetical protein VM186_05560 [Planctomycetota bacterium]|nr:hypothetical protein [Planctomycetota bacterium]